MIPSSPIVVDAELVHNWTQRYSHLAYFKNLGQDARAAVLRAHLQHHNKGANAQEMAVGLVAQFPAVFAIRP